jgi:hypothetical protein
MRIRAKGAPGTLVRGALLAAGLVAGCASMQDPAPVAAGTASAVVLAHKAGYAHLEYLAALGVVYALYDPWAPNWELDVTPLDETRLRFEMRLRAFHTGGEGEARRILQRNAGRLARERGYSGFEVTQFEEGVESTRPIARRVASAEVRLYKSRIFPDL